MKAGCFVDRRGADLMLTTDHASMAVRKARGLREAAKSNGFAKPHVKRSAEYGKRSEKSLSDLERLEVQIKNSSPLVKPSLKKKILQAITQKSSGSPA